MRTTLVLICAAILLLAFTSPIMAENVKMKDNPKCKNWTHLIGKWSWELEAQSDPTAPVENISGTEEFEWMYDGMFIQRKVRQTGATHGAIEIIAYDPVLRTHVSSAFQEKGRRWGMTSGGWNGNTFIKNITIVSEDGLVMPETCVLELSSDFNSRSIECKRYLDGQWWVSFKGQETNLK